MSGVAWAERLTHDQREDEAARVLASILTVWPRHAEARLAHARNLVRAGDAKAALADGLIALKQARSLATQRGAHALLAQVYSTLGNTKEAELHAAWIAQRR